MTVALIVAAGSGERLGADRPKAWVQLAGRTLLEWSLDAIAATPSVEHVVVAVPAAALEGGLAVPDGGPVPVTLVRGGTSRSDSVRRALAAAPASEIVLVHDAARPLVTPELAGEVVAALQADEQAGAAIAAAPVTDTIKRAGAERAVLETLRRDELWAVQTPQVFRRAVLEKALDVPGDVLAAATDDAWLVEQAGGKVLVVHSPATNMKVTTPVDLRVAELLLAERHGQL
jgi:2-C-methyl-D-erythritol 4-phosphate cytidylyltransferase